MKASELMTREYLWSCSESTDCREAAEMLAQHDIGSVPVLDSEGKLEGIVTDRDICCRLVARGMSFETPVREIMTREVHTVHADADVKTVESLMREYKIRRVPVVDDDNRLQGFIAQADLIRELHGWLKDHELVKTLEEISTP